MRDRLVELREDVYAEKRRCGYANKRAESALWALLVAAIDAVLEAQMC